MRYLGAVLTLTVLMSICCGQKGGSDAALCGNGVVELGETCDGNCPTACDDDDPCTSDTLIGANATCDATCSYEPRTECSDGDGCCPAGCDTTTDDDCSTCGNGVVEGGELCDGDCPTACDDGDSCTMDQLLGDPDTCDATCSYPPVTDCVAGDGCCPADCNATDADCWSCGNGVVDPGETCDGDCPTDCEDGDECTTDSLSGSAASCDATCTHNAITTCFDNDGCCPADCNANTDTDCSPVCGNGVVESTEACDGAAVACTDLGMPMPGTNPCVNCQLGPSTCCANPAWDTEILHDFPGSGVSGGIRSGRGLELDATDHPHVTYTFSSAAGSYTYYTHHDGMAWDRVFLDQGLFPSIALNSGGEIYISYRESTNQILESAFSQDGVVFTYEYVDTGVNCGTYTSTAIDSFDRPHISHRSQLVFDLKYAYHDGAAWQIETVDATGSLGYNSSLALDSFDRPHIAYRDVTNDNLKLAYHDGVAWQLQVVGGCGLNPGPVSLALDSLDRPHIVYVVTGNPDQVRYAYHNGTTWQIQAMVDTDRFLHSTLALDSLDRPHIAYANRQNGIFRYAYHDGNSWQIQVIPAPPLTAVLGQQVSLALDSNDRPQMSHFDNYGLLHTRLTCP